MMPQKNNSWNRPIIVLAVCVAMASSSFALEPWGTSAKRGIGMPLGQPNQGANLAKLDALDVPWFYSWSAEPASGFGVLPTGTSFVPMSWGRFAPANHQATWTAGGIAGLYDTLLGFNEPDLASQSNISVNDALNLWPLLEQTGLRLGSPATANLSNGWMSQFMSDATSMGLRVDFMALHHYAGADPQTFLDYIDSAYNQYQLPIWITEFAVRDGNASTPADNIYTDQLVYNFMHKVLPGLESRNFVERYAWFHSPRENPFVTSSALFENNGELTKLGRLYNGIVDPLPDGGLLLNSNFEDDELFAPVYEAPGVDQWSTLHNADTIAIYAHTGHQAISLAPGQASGQSKPGIVRQEFTVGVDVNINERYSMGAWVFNPSDNPLTGTREASLRIQWFDNDNSLMGDQRILAVDANTPTDEWFFVSLEDVLIPNNPNITEVRATLWVNNIGSTSVNTGVTYFDDVVFLQGSTLALDGDFDGDLDTDGEDLIAWQRGLSPRPLDSSDLINWRANYGLGLPLASHSIPEPTSTVLLVLACLGPTVTGVKTPTSCVVKLNRTSK